MVFFSGLLNHLITDSWERVNIRKILFKSLPTFEDLEKEAF